MTRFGRTVEKQSRASLTNLIKPTFRRVLLSWICMVGLSSAPICNSVIAAQRSALACINNLSLPVYDSLVWQAQITGTAVLQVKVASDGTASEVQVLQVPHKVFKEWLQRVTKESTFLTECAGQTLELTFKYNLEGLRREAPDNRVVVRAPGIFEITASPPILHCVCTGFPETTPSGWPAGGDCSKAAPNP